MSNFNKKTFCWYYRKKFHINPWSLKKRGYKSRTNSQHWFSTHTKQRHSFHIQISAVLKAVKVYLNLKILKFQLQLGLLWYRLKMYRCKLQWNPFAAIIILKKTQAYLKCLHLQRSPLIQLIIAFNFKLLHFYHFCILTAVKKNSLFLF